MYDTQNRLPPHLLTAAFRAGGEMAWPRQEALEAVKWLARQGLAILGGEVWIPSGSMPEIPSPFIYTWKVQPRAEEEDWSSFVVRAEGQASTYIRDFRWSEEDHAYQGRKPFFNLTVEGQAQ